MTLVERVTIAIGTAGDNLPPGGTTLSKHEALTLLARAAIEEMREPTDAMKMAGTHAYHSGDDPVPEVVWRAMIDAARAEGKP